jgi:hypothetical protein
MKKNTIKLKNYLNVFEEYKANAAITPGHLIEVIATDKVQVHATAGGNVLPMFAIEDELQGHGVDDAYEVDAQVQVWVPTRGDMVNAILADEENVVIGDFLVSAGDGTLKKFAGASSAAVVDVASAAIVGVAVSALNLSSSSAAAIENTRVQVRII